MRLDISRPWLGPEGKVSLEAPEGACLYQVIWLSGAVEPVPLCGGLGRCGRCRVRFLENGPLPAAEEQEILGEEAVSQGWRLACRCQIPDTGCLKLELPDPGRRREKGRPAASAAGPCVLAVDVGTTSVAWRVLDREKGTELASGEELNPQAGAGADVISRIAVALKPDGARRLADIIRHWLAGIIRSYGHQIQEVVLAANTAMTEIFAGTSVSGLAGAPYSLSLQGHETLSLPGLPPVYIPPLPAPFVGGDVTAGLVWLSSRATPKPFLLADLGTNGEIALVTADNRLYFTSVPLGPSLEGIGLECGALAGPDALTQFSLGPLGLNACTAAGAAPAPGADLRGISATGYLSLIELLLGLGLMDDEGHLGSFGVSAAMPLGRRLAARIDNGWQVPRFMVADRLWMSLRDVEEILKVKAAFSVAVKSVLDEAGLAARDLACLAIAGALGRYARPQMLERLGFVPSGLAGKILIAGNSSLEGACLLVLEPGAREELAALCAGAIVLQPALEPAFHERYLASMRFRG